MLARSMMPANFLLSDSTNALNCAGVVVRGTMPCLSSVSAIFGSANVLTVISLSRSHHRRRRAAGREQRRTS